MKLFYLSIYYLTTNFLLFYILRLDKKRAIKNKWRIKEKHMFTLGVLSGALGGLFGMFIFRHKVNKIKFYIVFNLSLFIHLILLCYIYNQF